MKRLSMLVATTLVAAAGLMALASPASAHHANMSVSVACNNAGSYDVTWVLNDWGPVTGGPSAKITASNRASVPVGTTFASGETKQFPESVSVKADLVLNISEVWSNGVTWSGSKTLPSSAFPADCRRVTTPEAPSVTAPTCSANGKLVVPADTDKVGYSQNPAGSGPGSYTVTATAKSGYKFDDAGTTTKTWNLTVEPKSTGSECWEKVTPAAPSVTDPTCTADGKLVVPADTTKVAYTQNPAGSGPGTYTVTATAKSGYKFDDGKTTRTWNLTVEPKSTGSECWEKVTPAAPSTTEPDCFNDGRLVVPDNTDSVTYAVKDLGDGTYEVTATAEPGYKFDDAGSTTKTWTRTVQHRLSCVEADGLESPRATAPTCTEDGSLYVPANTDQVTYTVTDDQGRPADSGTGTRVVEAVANDGYVLDGPARWEVEVLPALGDACVTPVAPAVTVIHGCNTFGSIDFADTPGVIYTLTEGNGKFGPYTVVATAAPGYVLADDAESVFTGDLGTPCTVSVVDPPVVSPIPSEGQVVDQPTAGEGAVVAAPAAAPAAPAGAPAAAPAAAPAHAPTVLPATGADGLLLPLGIAALLALAVGSLLIRRSRQY